MEHTKGPWYATASHDLGMVFSDNGTLIVPHHPNSENHENKYRDAHHIVACVNACEGINPEAVPDLLEALKVIANCRGTFNGADASGFVKIAERAIAKAKP